MKFYTRFSPPPSPSVKAKGGLTEQHFKDECDLNTVLRRFKATGIPAPMKPPTYADLTELPQDLTEAWEMLQFVEDWFSSLPSDVRESYDNDPLKAWKFVKENPKAAQDKGMLDPHSKVAEATTPEPPKPRSGIGEASGAVETQPPDPPPAG